MASLDNEYLSFRICTINFSGILILLYSSKGCTFTPTKLLTLPRTSQCLCTYLVACTSPIAAQSPFFTRGPLLLVLLLLCSCLTCSGSFSGLGAGAWFSRLRFLRCLRLRPLFMIGLGVELGGRLFSLLLSDELPEKLSGGGGV